MQPENMDLYEKFHSKSKLQAKIIDSNDFTYRNIIKVLDRYLKRDQRAIDVGCGVGTISLYVASKGLGVVGLDVSHSAIRLARESARLLGLNELVEFHRSDFRRVSPQGKYDLVIASEILEHLPDDQVVLKRLAKLVGKSGVLFLSAPLKNAPLYRLGLLKNFDKRVGHLRRYELRQLRFMIEESGLKIIYEGVFEGIIRNMLFTNRSLGKVNRIIKGGISSLVTFLDNISLSFLGPSQVIVVAKK